MKDFEGNEVEQAGDADRFRISWKWRIVLVFFLLLVVMGLVFWLSSIEQEGAGKDLEALAGKDGSI